MFNDRVASFRKVVLLGLALVLLATACGGGNGDVADTGATPEDGEQDVTTTPEGDATEEEAAQGEPVGEPVNLQLASYLGPRTADTEATQQWAERVTELTGGTVTIELFLQEALIPATDILSGVAAGRAGMGGMSHGYHPGEMPLSHVMNLSFVTDNLPAQIATLRALYEEDEEYRAEWDRNGVRPILFNIQSSTILGCREPISSHEDMAGQRVRAAALITHDFEGVGAEVLALPAPEIRESIERGLLDCWSALPLDLGVDFGLHETTPSLYDYGRGSNGATQAVISLSVWESLSEGQQEAMLTAADEVSADFVEITDQRLRQACDELAEAGVSFERLDDSAIEAWREAVEDRVTDAYLELSGEAGAAFLERYLERLEEFEAEFADYVSPVRECADRTS